MTPTINRSSGNFSCRCNTKHPAKQTHDSRFRDRVVRTNLDLILIGLVLALFHAGHAYANEAAATVEETASSAGEVHQATGETEEEILLQEQTDVYAVLYPWFVEIVGVFAYYFLSRYVHALPYTAVMFIVGFFIGYSVQRTAINGITESATKWINIEGEVILLVFLPGLLYLDSYNIDIHLFLQSFWQLVTFAFPMVLGGTALTACVSYYIFPYGWSFDLSMTFGAILSATDPVAVAVLLNELGAPPRLKMHIAGESLLNDGSAVVFYSIFSSRFFYEMGIPGIGDEIGWGEGFLMFFRLSLGGMCIGLVFGVGTVFVLYHLNRRLSGEDSVVQVVLTITVAYLTFFTSEILAHCSGIIAVMFCGLTVKAMGETMINHTDLMDHFWEIAEYLLNTLLFTLGGTVWGDIMSNNRATEEFQGAFVGSDWGYLILLYVLLTVIRYFLLVSFYPITSRIGIGSNWKEVVFMGWGGLRGAVGIALALSLNSEVNHYTEASDVDEQTRRKFQDYTTKLFGFVGGIAFLTLIINGISSGPLLHKLGLVTPTETRKKVLENYRQHMINHAVEEYVELLADERFKDLDYTVIKSHVSFLKDITLDQLLAAVKKHKNKTPAQEYIKPNLKNVVPYLYQPETNIITDAGTMGIISEIEKTGVTFGGDVKAMRRRRQTSVQAMRRDRSQRTTVFDVKAHVDEREVYEERLIFLRILRSCYYKLIEHGELESRGFIPHSFFRSLDLEEDRAVRGLSLNDWEALQVASSSWARPAEYLRKRAFELKHQVKGSKGMTWGIEFFLVHLQVRQALAFIEAHKKAAKIFKEEFTTDRKHSLTSAEKVVLDESAAQVKLADKVLLGIDKEDVKMIKSHYACQVLLSKSAHYFARLSEHGLMTQREAGEFMEEIESEMYDLLSCREFVHEDEMTQQAKMHRFSRIPDYMLADMSLQEEVDNFRNVTDNQDVSGFFSSPNP